MENKKQQDNIENILKFQESSNNVARRICISKKQRKVSSSSEKSMNNSTNFTTLHRIIVLPAAVAIGALGYAIESELMVIFTPISAFVNIILLILDLVSSKHTPGTESVIKQRIERQTRDLANLTSVKDAKYEDVLGQNLSPSLQARK